MREALCAVVAGHICLDIIPKFVGEARSLGEILIPGSMVRVGDAALSTGGAVSNTGVALHKLGIPTTLIGKIGDDFLGEITRSVLERHGEGLSQGMRVSKGEGSSYTVVLNPPGIDRMFLHHPGPNDTFGCEDVTPAALDTCSLFHFGYPPLMRRMFEDEGRELEKLFVRAKSLDIVTSLDMTMPDPSSDQGRAPWRAILERVLPHVDLFLPSIDEASFMLAPTAGPLPPPIVADELLAMGASLVLLKLGASGLYMKTAKAPKLLFMEALGQQPRIWAGLELSAAAYEVAVTGTTGCGDSTIAGFLAALLRGLPPQEALDVAAAAGSCTAERPDALSGVPDWDSLIARIESGWPRKSA